MTQDDTNSLQQPQDDGGDVPAESPSDAIPEIEDANVVDEPVASDLEEDDPQLLTPEARSLGIDVVDDDQVEGVDSAEVEARTREAVEKDDTSDTDSIMDDESVEQESEQERIPPSLDQERSARPLIVELKRIESEVRRIIEGRDSKRKRKLGGTRRWLELEEDLVSWRVASRFDNASLSQLEELVRKRHHLFRHLQFIAGTRPTWNS